jgi:hypothetical protein
MGALAKNCSRSGCHTALERYADLDLHDPATIAAQMIDKPATHGDIGCNTPPAPFRECTSEELVALGCPTVKLIDSQNFDASWVVAKINGSQLTCGLAMPIAPGNSPTAGWSDQRRACFIEFFRSLVPSP